MTNTFKHIRPLTDEDIANMPTSFTIPSRLAKEIEDRKKRPALPQALNPSEPEPVGHQFRPTSKPIER